MPGTYLDPRVQKKKKKPEQFGPLYPGQNAGQGKSLPEIPKKPGEGAGKNIGLKDIPLGKPTKPATTGGAHPPGGIRKKAATTAFPARPTVVAPNTSKSKPKAAESKPMGMSFNGTQVQTQKGPANGQMSHTPEKGATVKKRGSVTTSQAVMDVRMNNQRTIRGKLRDSKGGRG